MISVVWSYTGLTAEDVESAITTYSEYAMTTTVNGIERIESQTLNGVALIRVYLYPDADVSSAFAGITAVSQAVLHLMPPHIYPPIILGYTPSSVPIIQMILSSETMPEQDLYDYTNTSAEKQDLRNPRGYAAPPLRRKSAGDDGGCRSKGAAGAGAFSQGRQ